MEHMVECLNWLRISTIKNGKLDADSMDKIYFRSGVNIRWVLDLSGPYYTVNSPNIYVGGTTTLKSL